MAPPLLLLVLPLMATGSSGGTVGTPTVLVGPGLEAMPHAVRVHNVWEMRGVGGSAKAADQARVRKVDVLISGQSQVGGHGPPTPPCCHRWVRVSRQWGVEGRQQAWGQHVVPHWQWCRPSIGMSTWLIVWVCTSKLMAVNAIPRGLGYKRARGRQCTVLLDISPKFSA